jgi:hypothetical protein
MLRVYSRPLSTSYTLDSLPLAFRYWHLLHNEGLALEHASQASAIGGCDYSKRDFLDVYHKICLKSLRKHAIVHTGRN